MYIHTYIRQLIIICVPSISAVFRFAVLPFPRFGTISLPFRFPFRRFDRWKHRYKKAAQEERCIFRGACANASPQILRNSNNNNNNNNDTSHKHNTNDNNSNYNYTTTTTTTTTTNNNNDNNNNDNIINDNNDNNDNKHNDNDDNDHATTSNNNSNSTNDNYVLRFEGARRPRLCKQAVSLMR